MKLHFESDLSYQLEAIEAVCDLFRGQEVCRSVFTVTAQALGIEASQQSFEGKQFTESGGIGNALQLVVDEELNDNLQQVQLRNGLPPSGSLKASAALDFTVEMETGTGKTYVYLRTVFELNQRYGFTKFVVVVPSIAIKEGVNKTLQITREHFESLYPAAKGYEFFQYDSDKLGQVRNFATSPNIQIMVVTVGAINKFGDATAAQAEETDEAKRREKSRNKMYRVSEKTGGERPIDLIRQTRPILIVDEPQSVDGGIDGKGRQALAHMAPLCTLRYSATHVDKHHMVYRLDAVDAYDQKLVKQIEVAAATRLQWKKAGMTIGKSGVDTAELSVSEPTALYEHDLVLPDLLTELQNRTQLTRKTIARILSESRRLNDFRRNPQQFVEVAAEAINRCKRLALVDGIKYQQLGEDHYYAQELFETEELTGYLKNLVLDTQKSVYEHVVYDSTIERDFAEALEKNEAVKVFAKLPGWFKVPTPLGSYNPDWAVLVERDGQERLYFVVETKSSLFEDDLRERESGKINCGTAHFQALSATENPARFAWAKDVDALLTQ